MILRLVVVVAFALTALVPAYLAYDAGLLPSPTDASADIAGGRTDTPIVALAWPEEPLGLAASGSTVFWEQRDPDPAVSGLWSLDVPNGHPRRVLDRSLSGKSAFSPAAGGELVVWSAWKRGRRTTGTPRVEAYNTVSTRRWTAAREGRDPTVSGTTVLWVEPDGGLGGDLIRGLDSLTDERYVVEPKGRVRAVAAWGGWVAWLSGGGERSAVWAASYRREKRRRLAGAGTAVALDRDRILWAAPGKGISRLMSWDRRAKESGVLCRVPGTVTGLTLGPGFAAWVATRADADPRVWVYDFAAGRAFPVADGDGRQVSPVLAADSVFWADDRDGEWALYRRALR